MVMIGTASGTENTMENIPWVMKEGKSFYIRKKGRVYQIFQKGCGQVFGSISRETAEKRMEELDRK